MTTGVGGCRGGCGNAAIAVVPARAVLETEMAEGAPDNRAAWARFIDPRVV